MVDGVGVSDEYSRSKTACEEDLLGMEVSSVALGTLEEVVEDAMEDVSSVHQP
jgi:hypothetical protein